MCCLSASLLNFPASVCVSVSCGRRWGSVWAHAVKWVECTREPRPVLCGPGSAALAALPCAAPPLTHRLTCPLVRCMWSPARNQGWAPGALQPQDPHSGDCRTSQADFLEAPVCMPGGTHALAGPPTFLPLFLSFHWMWWTGTTCLHSSLCRGATSSLLWCLLVPCAFPPSLYWLAHLCVGGHSVLTGVGFCGHACLGVAGGVLAAGTSFSQGCSV